MASNPMQQFSVYKIGPEIKIAGVDLSFTNASLFMVISASIIIFFLFFGSKEKKIIPDKIQLIAEMFYTFVAKMISDTAGSKAKPYFPFIFSLFMFVLFCNMVGMLPYSFTVTSHIIVTLIMALFIFIAVTIIGFAKHGFKYLSIFVPNGVPAVLLPLITVIEIISYLSRPVSLSVRLFANNLTDKLTGLLRYEIISIIVINGSRTAGTPLGTKILRYLSPCFANPIIVTAIKINNANIKVTII